MTLSLSLAIFTIGLASTAWVEPLAPAATPGPASAPAAPKPSSGWVPDLKFNLAAQLRFSFEDKTQGPGRPHRQTDSLKLQRVRPSVTARFFDQKLLFKLHLNTGPTTVELLDMFLDAALPAHLKLRIGNQKTPFTRYRNNSVMRLNFADWSLASRFFGLERQIGLQVFGSPLTALDTAFGVFAGSNVRSAFERGPSMVYGKARVNRSRLNNPGPASRVHPEIFAQVSYRILGDAKDFKSDQDLNAGDLKAMFGVSGAYDVAPQIGEDLAARVAFEAWLKGYGASLHLIGYNAWFQTHDTKRIQQAAFGGMAELSYTIASAWVFALRSSYVESSLDMRNDARAFSKLPSSGALSLKAPGSFRYQVAHGAALSGLLVEHHLKWTTDLSWIESGGNGKPEQSWLVRAQLQIQF